jgi:hypothetical protein
MRWFRRRYGEPVAWRAAAEANDAALLFAEDAADAK